MYDSPDLARSDSDLNSSRNTKFPKLKDLLGAVEMDDFGLFARDLGFRPQGKSAPMAPPKGSRSSSSSFADDQFSDVFGGPPKYTSSSNNKSTSSLSDFDYDSIFKSSSSSATNDSKVRSSSPVYDKPVYDEDIFDGLPGLKSKSTSASSRVGFDSDAFESISNQNQRQSAAFDDLLGNFGRNDKAGGKSTTSSRGLVDDLIPGFGGSSSPPRSSRPLSEPDRPQNTSSTTKPTYDVMEDPFVVLESNSTPSASSPGLFTDPLEEISKIGNSGNTKVSGSSVSGRAFDDLDPLDGFGQSVPAFSSEMNSRVKEGSPSTTGSSMGKVQTSVNTEAFGSSSFRDYEIDSQKLYDDNFQESHQTMSDIPSVSTDSRTSVGQNPFDIHADHSEMNAQVDKSPESEEYVDPSDEVWLTVSEVPLFTQPTGAPPPSRPPPPIPTWGSKSEAGFFASNARKKGNEFSSSPNSSQYSQTAMPTRSHVKSGAVSQIDELEDFAMGRGGNYVDEDAEEMNTNSSAAAASAAAMKDAMDKAEAKFRHAKEVREREYAKTARSREAVQLEKDEHAIQDDEEGEFKDNQERLDSERRQREEEERRRLEKERERAREIEREKGKARQAVERATREARERAAADARERAAAELRLKAERAAVGRVQAEARERAERAAVQRVQAGARDRAAAEARERAEKAAADAKERANAEAREKAAAAAKAEAEARRKAERAAVERAAAEARERAATEAREKAAAAARMNQQKNDNDLESFFGMGSRPSSAPRPRANSSVSYLKLEHLEYNSLSFLDPMADPQFQSKGGPEGARTSVSSSSNMRKASSTTNIVDDLTSIFGASPSAGEFQDVEGETEERRRARLERHQRTQERAAKALAEKNQRDLQTLRDQEERYRIAETLDVEIKRWAAGKEGNLRALLSTMQYVSLIIRLLEKQLHDI
ncbi:hypothetical protein C3L33_07208, partial [Rhododendron williamsianum]